ncbi:hypothetical protein Tcan_07680 [Toxocara canis]|uniref:Transmembrane protein n=1 Tax=Toxocara canis TaxID=6265 RepID=A0A0B2VQW3_TOXCA|nr:hypothetical protein Tcan_07680 [Toxocara canis]
MKLFRSINYASKHSENGFEDARRSYGSVIIAAIFVFVAALATTDWAIIDFTNTELEAVHVQLGVWGEWRTKTNHSLETVEWIPHFPAPPASVLRLADTDLKPMCIVVTVEVLTNSVNEWNISVAEQSKNVDWDYSVGQTNGRSTYMAWSCVFIYALAAVTFALGSHKQKGSRAATAEFEIEDRPIHIGR